MSVSSFICILAKATLFWGITMASSLNNTEEGIICSYSQAEVSSSHYNLVCLLQNGNGGIIVITNVSCGDEFREDITYSVKEQCNGRQTCHLDDFIEHYKNECLLDKQHKGSRSSLAVNYTCLRASQMDRLDTADTCKNATMDDSEGFLLIHDSNFVTFYNHCTWNLSVESATAQSPVVDYCCNGNLNRSCENGLHVRIPNQRTSVPVKSQMQAHCMAEDGDVIELYTAESVLGQELRELMVHYKDTDMPDCPIEAVKIRKDPQWVICWINGSEPLTTGQRDQPKLTNGTQATAGHEAIPVAVVAGFLAFLILTSLVVWAISSRVRRYRKSKQASLLLEQQPNSTQIRSIQDEIHLEMEENDLYDPKPTDRSEKRTLVNLEISPKPHMIWDDRMAGENSLINMSPDTGIDLDGDITTDMDTHPYIASPRLTGRDNSFFSDDNDEAGVLYESADEASDSSLLPANGALQKEEELGFENLALTDDPCRDITNNVEESDSQSSPLRQSKDHEDPATFQVLLGLLVNSNQSDNCGANNYENLENVRAVNQTMPPAENAKKPSEATMVENHMFVPAEKHAGLADQPNENLNTSPKPTQGQNIDMIENDMYVSAENHAGLADQPNENLNTSPNPTPSQNIDMIENDMYVSAEKHAVLADQPNENPNTSPKPTPGQNKDMIENDMYVSAGKLAGSADQPNENLNTSPKPTQGQNIDMIENDMYVSADKHTGLTDKPNENPNTSPKPTTGENIDMIENDMYVSAKEHAGLADEPNENLSTPYNPTPGETTFENRMYVSSKENARSVDKPDENPKRSTPLETSQENMETAESEMYESVDELSLTEDEISLSNVVQDAIQEEPLYETAE